MARPANSAKPSQKAASSEFSLRKPRARRAASARPAPATTETTKPATRSSRAASVEPEAQMINLRKTKAIPVADPSRAKPTLSFKAKALKKEEVVEVKNTHSGWGDNHAATEDKMMAEHAKICLEKGRISEEIAANWAKAWHVKGELEMKWSKEVLDHYREDDMQVDTDIMDLKKAEAIAKKKDAERKKFLEEYFAGKIDENGSAIPQENPAATAPIKKKESSIPSKAIKKTAIEKKTRFLDILEESPSPAPPKSKKNPSPLPGFPNYAEYNYYHCAALCFERNLISGGNTEVLRNRLIQDDINVVQHLPREAKPYSREKQRKRGNKAPVVPNAPRAPPAVFTGKRKRKKEDEGDGDEEEVMKKTKGNA